MFHNLIRNDLRLTGDNTKQAVLMTNMIDHTHTRSTGSTKFICENCEKLISKLFQQ